MDFVNCICDEWGTVLDQKNIKQKFGVPFRSCPWCGKNLKAIQTITKKREIASMDKTVEIIPDEMPAWAKEAMEKGQFFREALKRIDDLEDFAIWMTGCGYDFCQHEYFCQKRDELLKG